MWLFRKKPKAKSYPDIVKAQARETMKINLLSPTQIEKVISNNQDIDFLQQEMKAEMNFPDIEYLLKCLMPKQIRRTARKPISVEDVMMGVFCGDIIGSKFEFTEHDYAAARNMTLPAHKSYHTDDTVLTRATYHAIQANPENPDFRQAYINAYHNEKDAGYGAAFVNWAENGQMFYVENMEARSSDSSSGYHSCANGCAMRISPIPAYYDDLVTATKHAVASCMVTHDHVESVKSVIVLTVCVWMALHGYAKKEIYDYCYQCYPMSDELFYKASQFDMNQPLNEISNDVSRRSLMANYAVPFAVKCFYQTACFEDCMSEILTHYGDTDTICAIAGGLCVAFYGTTGMDNQAILDSDWHKV